MTSYTPILKGKQGELQAWAHAVPRVTQAARPVFELVPTKNGLQHDVGQFTAGLARSSHKGVVTTVDAGHMDQNLPIGDGDYGAVGRVGIDLYSLGVLSRPVVRIGDGARVLAESAGVAGLCGQGVCLRLERSAALPSTARGQAVLDTLLASLNVDVSQVHLLIDLQATPATDDPATALAVANALLSWASTRGPWGSVTVAGGAFPVSISSLPYAQPNLIQRADAAIWRALSVPTGLEIGYGDYAVNHPVLPATSPPRGPLPSLRYASGRHWVVWREQATEPGNSAFFTVCEGVVSLPAWSGADYSWGDAEVDRSARSIGGAGTATQWRAYGTSHHLATVVDRLATLGEP